MKKLAILFFCAFAVALGVQAEAAFGAEPFLTANTGMDLDRFAPGQTGGGVQFLRTFYKRYFNMGYEEPYLRSVCTQKCLKKLRADYEYDGDGIAVWAFRVGGNDPNVAEQLRSMQILAAANGWYNVRLKDGGKWSTVRIKLVRVGKSYKIDDYRNLEM